jgi:hypothetical protein
MRRTILIEGILLLVLSFVSMAEGLRLTLFKDPHTFYDMLGPGLYIFVVGIGLTATGLVHLLVNYKKAPGAEKVAVNREMRIRMIGMILVLAIYIFLIDIFGYLVSTTIFFLIELRIVGIKSWKTNIILTIVLTGVYYIVFVEYCNMLFPRGILFR